MAPNANEIARLANLARSKVDRALADIRADEITTATIDNLERAQSLLGTITTDAERLSETLRDLS
jgi:hypothetical protein